MTVCLSVMQLQWICAMKIGLGRRDYSEMMMTVRGVKEFVRPGSRKARTMVSRGSGIGGGGGM